MGHYEKVRPCIKFCMTSSFLACHSWMANFGFDIMGTRSGLVFVDHRNGSSIVSFIVDIQWSWTFSQGVEFFKHITELLGSLGASNPSVELCFRLVATTGWVQLFHMMVAPHRMNKYPVTDLRVLIFVVWAASRCPTSQSCSKIGNGGRFKSSWIHSNRKSGRPSRDSGCLYNMPHDLVVRKYRQTCFRAF